MLQTNTELKRIYKELEKIFGEKAVEKIYSHISSLGRRCEDLELSRDKWKERALKAERKLKK